MAKKKYEEQDGVWRTIGGRRVFIKTGQSLSDAMKASGKFGRRETDIKSHIAEEIDEDTKDIKRTQGYIDRARNPKVRNDYRLDRDRIKRDRTEKEDFLDYYDNPRESKADTSKLDGKHIEKKVPGHIEASESQLRRLNEYKDVADLRDEWEDRVLSEKEKISSEEYNKRLDNEYKNLKDGKIDTKEYLKRTDDIMNNYTTDRIEQGQAKAKGTKSIHTQSGDYTQNELKNRDENIKQLYKDTWEGKKDYSTLHKELEEMKASGKASQGELDALKYDASLETGDWQNNPKNAHRGEYIGNNTVASKETNWREQIKKNNEQMEKELAEYEKNHDISRESDNYYEIFRNNERRNAKIKQEVPTEPYEYVEAYAGYHDKSYKLAGTKMSGKAIVEYGNKSWTGKEYTNDEFMEHLTDSNWHQERKMLENAKLTNQELSYIKDRTTLSQWSVGEELTGSKNVEKMIKEAKNHFASGSNNLMSKYSGTVDYLKKTTNMNGADILELLKKIEQEKK